MPTMNMKCCCKAEFDATGDNIWLEFRAKGWLEKHAKCPEIYRPVSNPQVIRLLRGYGPRKNFEK
jgi:hypothetical protein